MCLARSHPLNGYEFGINAYLLVLNTDHQHWYRELLSQFLAHPTSIPTNRSVHLHREILANRLLWIERRNRTVGLFVFCERMRQLN